MKATIASESASSKLVQFLKIQTRFLGIFLDYIASIKHPYKNFKKSPGFSRIHGYK